MEARISRTPAADSEHDLETRKKRLLENCHEFESVMISYLLKTMENSVMKAEEPGQAEGMYQDMFVAQMSRQLGKNSALGFGNMLYSKLEPLLEAKSKPARPDTAPPEKSCAAKPPHGTASAAVNGLKNSSVSSDCIKKEVSDDLSRATHRTRREHAPTSTRGRT